MLASSLTGTRLGAQRLAAPLAQQRCSVRAAPAPLTIEAAHKKGAGSTKNGRDSNSKRRGVKAYGGQPVIAGNIIIRQLGTKVHPGDNVGLGKDYTLYSKIDGIVVFKKNSKAHKVHVVPVEEYVIPEGQRAKEGSRKQRKREARAAERAETRALAGVPQ